MAPVSKAGEFLQAAEKLFFGKGTVAVAVDALEDGNHLLCTHFCYGFVRHGRYVHHGQNGNCSLLSCDCMSSMARPQFAVFTWDPKKSPPAQFPDYAKPERKVRSYQVCCRPTLST